jgi:colicin import membrane protein
MATKTLKQAARAKRSKAEIEEEFSNIREEAAAAREAAEPKTEELARLKEAELRQAIEGVTVEGVVQNMSLLGLEISKALTDLSGKLVREVDRLAAVREAVTLEERELGRLHQLDVAATALDQLVQDYERQKERLHAEISAERAAWEEEKRQAERDRKEQEEILRKQRLREMEDYQYKQAQERKKAQDRYEEETQLAEKQQREKQEALEKSWQQREAALKEREEELLRLKKEAESFPARLEKECERAAAEARRALEQKLEQQTLLLQKGHEADQRLAELRIKTLEEELARQTTHVAALEKQLDEAKQQVQEIAVKAIEGASGAKALSHINQIAMEQAKHRAPPS